MGVGRFFSRGGAVGDFPKFFSGRGAKVVKFGFYPSWLKNQRFFANNFKIQACPPSDAHACNDSLFADMTLTLDKSQVHCFGNMQLWACSSLMSASLPVEALSCEFFCYWPLLRNNNMATNLRRFPSSYDDRRFGACNFWTQTSWQVTQRDSNCC